MRSFGVIKYLPPLFDITFADGGGNEVKENHVHDVQFVGNQIKRINVYSRPASEE